MSQGIAEQEPLPTVRPGRRWPVLAVSALVVLPLGPALLAAVRAPKSHVLLDFWHVLAKITADDGSLQAASLFGYHLEQPFVVPSLLFWADAAWFGGDNRVLTVLSVVLAAVAVLVLRTLLPDGMTPLLRAGLTTAFAFALLSPQATELWVQATNGISWLPAVLASLVAIALTHHGRVWLGCAAAAFGCLCFGAAFPALFVVALVAWLRREGRARVLAPLAGGLLVLGFWAVTRPSAPQSLASSAADPERRLAVFFAALGGLFTPGAAAPAVLAGAVIFGVLTLAGLSALRDRRGDRAGWAGVGAYALALAAMLALGRMTPAAVEGNVGLVSRYVLVSALATCAALVLCCLHRPAWPVRHVVVASVTAGLLTQGLGATRADAVRNAYAPLGMTAPALWAGATTVLTELRVEPGVRPAARALGTYPFSGDYTPGCGREFAETVDLAALPVLAGPAGDGSSRGVVDTAEPAGDTLLTGWAVVEGERPVCVLVADGAGTVVGTGITGLPHADVGTAGAGWHAVAPPGTAEPVVLVGTASALYRVPQEAGP